MIGQLTNHLWQSTVFALAAGLLTLAFRTNRAKVRYSLWLIASLKFLIPFSLLIGFGSGLEWLPVAQKIASRAPSPDVLFTMEQFSQPFVSVNSTATRTRRPRTDRRLIAAAGIWLCGFVAIACLRGRGWRRVRAAVRRSVPIELAQPVKARLSSSILEPGVVGFWHPVLLLPHGILERLTPSELEAVIAHELCHVRRRDNLFASIQMLVEALFWFHPLVWWIGARLVDERERACDEDVVSLGNRPEVYADAILNVCKLCAESPLACVSGVTGADIRRRIEAIMSHQGVSGLNLAKKTLLACAGVAAVIGPVAAGLLIGIGHVTPLVAQFPAPALVAPRPVLVAQQLPVPAAKPIESPRTPQPAPKFDAVSIRQCAPGEVGRGRGGGGGSAGPGPNIPPGLAGYFSVSPGRFSVSCGSIMTMIDWAYIGSGDEPLVNDTHAFLSAPSIKGVPGWAISARFTIEASTDDPVANGPTERMTDPAHRLMSGPMFRAVLEDRFQLKIHRDMEDIPMYALTVAKGGLKIKPVTDADCTQPETGPGGRGFLIKTLHPGDNPYCGWMGGNAHGPNRTVLGGGAPLSRLAAFLSGWVMDRHVIDKTGIADKFNIHLEFSPDETTPCNIGGPACQTDPNSDVPPAPSIFTALEQQLGLKLESVKAPHGFIMVDHVEPPSEN
jgi:bla regulator protein blaR1